MRWKPWIMLIGLISSILLPLSYLANYGFSFPPCSSYEIPLPVPDLMQTSDIVFEKQMYYMAYTSKKIRLPSKTCPNNIEQEAVGFIEPNSQPYQSSGWKRTPVATGTRFTLIRRANIVYRGLNKLRGGNDDHYLIRNDKGEDWHISPIYFLNSGRWVNENEPKWTAGYYKDGQRIGDVVVQDTW